MASLVTLDGTSFELAEQETLVGRGGREMNDPPKVDVGVLEAGATVSRHHARIFRRGGQWFLRSEPTARNPTLVEGVRIPNEEECPLADGARVQLGDVVLTFRAPQEGSGQGFDATMIEDVPPAAAPVIPPPPAAPPAFAPAAATAVAPSPPAATATVAPVAPPRPALVIQTVPSAPPRADWAARLPAGATGMAALGITEFKRVNPFKGLMVDEDTWADAHDYHRNQLRLHLLSGHGWGIVEGLEVVADPFRPNSLAVRPGVAIDADGHALVLARELKLTLPAEAGSTQYLSLRWREELAQPQRFWNDLDEYTRAIERCEVVVQNTPIAPPALELARILVTGSIADAAEPLYPQPGEVDLRFRERMGVRPRAELGVAMLVADSAGGDGVSVGHSVGLRYLLREIGLTTAYRARWAGVCRPGEPIPAVSLLCLTGAGGFTLDNATQGRLREFLDAGGVLMADGCQSGNAAEFTAAAGQLAAALGRQPEPVTRWHPLLTARHLFTEPPLAGKVMTLAEGGGFVLSSCDYGCAWQGGREGQPLGREAIRATLELGVNIAVYARRRQQPLEAIDLEA